MNMNQKNETVQIQTKQNDVFFDDMDLAVQGMGGYVVLKVKNLQQLAIDGSEEATWWLTPEEAKMLAEALLRAVEKAGRA
jgi:hypothetical protein